MSPENHLPETSPCKICGAATHFIGERRSEFSTNRAFTFASCEACGYTCVVDPRTDFASLYDADYYAGRGADPLTDYEAELANPRSVREYEWSALLRIVGDLGGNGAATRWLDYGCGLGGAVRYARRNGFAETYGFDEGYAAESMQRAAIPHLTREELPSNAGTFDVITSIDVIEHTVDPLGYLREVRALLRPGGTLFVVTGNAEPFRAKMLGWSYTTVPDVHVGFFEPRTLRRAYDAAGLTTLDLPTPAAFDGLLRYKILKNLRLRNRSWPERLIPWPLVTRLADRRYQLSAFPLARRDE
jgi:SAM-dependent methyltransferase